MLIVLSVAHLLIETAESKKMMSSSTLLFHCFITVWWWPGMAVARWSQSM